MQTEIVNLESEVFTFVDVTHLISNQADSLRPEIEGGAIARFFYSLPSVIQQGRN